MLCRYEGKQCSHPTLGKKEKKNHVFNKTFEVCYSPEAEIKFISICA